MRTVRYKFYIMVKNQQTRLSLLKFLVAQKIPEHYLNSVNTLYHDPITGKEEDEVVYGIEFWADLPPGCENDVFDMIIKKFDKKIEFCYSRIVRTPRIRKQNSDKIVKKRKNPAELEFTDAWKEESDAIKDIRSGKTKTVVESADKIISDLKELENEPKCRFPRCKKDAAEMLASINGDPQLCVIHGAIWSMNPEEFEKQFLNGTSTSTARSQDE